MQMIETQEQVTHNSLKTVALKSVDNSQEEEAKRKQEEALRRARWSTKAMEQATLEA